MTNPETTLLVVDDEMSNLESLERIFSREGFRVLTADSGRKALDLCRQHRVHVVLTDLMMPGMTGMELLKALETVAPDASVVLMTAYGTIETAVEAIRAGAYDFVEKPLKRMQIVKSVQKAAERHALVAENKTLKEELSQLRAKPAGSPIIGSSTALRQALEIASQAAPSTANVLILGESGTGKELLARFIHTESRRKGPFVAVNLAALPETIVEGEIFGYEKGAFTGAVQRRDGRIAQAEGGTLFLDEIGELSLAVQVKLLRVIQEGTFEPLGGKTRSADFRLVAATNKDLRQLVAEGRFREDLYYRLNVVNLHLPPLRDRGDDIVVLAKFLLDKYAKELGSKVKGFTPNALIAIHKYDWPGNVRQLENRIKKAIVLCDKTLVGPEDLDLFPEALAPIMSLTQAREEFQRRYILEVLERNNGNRTKTARDLGVDPRTIFRYLEREPDAPEPGGPDAPAPDAAEGSGGAV
jgi:two-component system response regulator HydG